MKQPPPDDTADGEELPGVVEVPVRCPYCNSLQTTVTSTQGTTRYRKCKECERRFKSIFPSE